MSKIIRQNYSLEFRAEAIKMVLEQGQSISGIIRSLKISIQTLSNWVAKARHAILESAADHKPETMTLEAEIKRLKKALVVAIIMRDILKKATAYFAKGIL